jgi:sugar transferase (PEP-CTERM/EpsH1 system associated)
LTISQAPLIAHVILRLDVGGLENGLVNLINGLPQDDFRHAIICIDQSTDFAKRIKRKDVEIVEIGKRPGFDLRALWRLYTTIKRLKPKILHTRNLAALDALLPGMLAGVRYRIHGEHGWDVNDLAGTNPKLRWLRKLHSPMVTRYVAVSVSLRNYLIDRVGVESDRVSTICNGVDTVRFQPNPTKTLIRNSLNPIFDKDAVVFGTVGRMSMVKGHIDLVESFGRIACENNQFREHARLVIVGDGPTRDAVIGCTKLARISEMCWLPGYRDDIPDLIASLDVYVQPSLAEGISNTVLEAMASGLPVIATRVGGNSELVRDGETGTIVPVSAEGALARALLFYFNEDAIRKTHGQNARGIALREFSIDKMLEEYSALYQCAIET